MTHGKALYIEIYESPNIEFKKNVFQETERITLFIYI